MSRLATDLLRVFAVSCIVFNHVSWPLFVSSSNASAGPLAHIAAIMNQLGKPSVLFFLFLSGVAFSGKKDNLSPAAFYRSRLLRIVPPFLLFSLIFSLYAPDPIHWYDPILWLFTGSAQYHLYFVAVLLYLYICYPLLREIPYRPSYLLTLIGLGLSLHLINSLRYQAALPVFMGFRLTDVGSLHLEQPGAEGNPGSVIWLEYFAFAVPFFMAGLWLPEIVKKHGLALHFPELPERNTGTEGWSEGSALEKRIRHMADRGVEFLRSLSAGHWFQLSFRLLLVAGGFLLVFNDFVAGYSAGLHPDPAGRVWRISVALYAVALILFLIALPRAHSPLWLKKLSRASFLVYLLHPIWIDATRFLHPWYQTQVVIPLSWLSALALHELALAFPALGLFMGEGERVNLSRKPADNNAGQSAVLPGRRED
ncbi:MAG: acyltransferase [Leptospiraceae bacterium]|nr:acyltransferase [Leptospiraceae bacterium]